MPGYVFVEPRLPSYTLVRYIKKQANWHGYTVGIYQTEDQGEVVIKTLGFQVRNLAFSHMLNEISMLEVTNSLQEKAAWIANKVRSPRLIKVVREAGQISLVMEFIEGDTLQTSEIATRFEAISRVIEALRLSADLINRDVVKKIPIRKRLPMGLYFWFYAVFAFLRHPKKAPLLLKMTGKFYLDFFKGILSNKPVYVFAHKDLHSRNVIIGRNDAVTILDVQVSVFAEPVTDVAVVALRHYGEVGDRDLVSFLNRALKTDDEKMDFQRLAIYYAFSVFAFSSRTSIKNKLVLDFLEGLDKKILPSLRKLKVLLQEISIQGASR